MSTALAGGRRSAWTAREPRDRVRKPDARVRKPHARQLTPDGPQGSIRRMIRFLVLPLLILVAAGVASAHGGECLLVEEARGAKPPAALSLDHSGDRHPEEALSGGASALLVPALSRGVGVNSRSGGSRRSAVARNRTSYPLQMADTPQPPVDSDLRPGHLREQVSPVRSPPAPPPPARPRRHHRSLAAIHPGTRHRRPRPPGAGARPLGQGKCSAPPRHQHAPRARPCLGGRNHRPRTGKGVV